MDQGSFTTRDGACLRYQTFGQGPAVVIANGIGVIYLGVMRQIQALQGAGYRVICWDYRGIGHSTLPRPGGDLSMSRHAQDAFELMDHLGEERAVFLGWSMGVQVALEAIRLQPARVVGYVGLFGAHSNPFACGLPRPLSRAVEAVFAFGRRNPWVADGLLGVAAQLPRTTFLVCAALTFVGRDADRRVYHADVQAYAGHDKVNYFDTMFALMAHDARDVLPRISCPALIVSATRDWICPPKVGREMAERIPGAVYREVQGGSHFSLIEQVALVNGWVLDLVARAHAGAPPASARPAGAAPPVAER